MLLTTWLPLSKLRNLSSPLKSSKNWRKCSRWEMLQDKMEYKELDLPSYLNNWKTDNVYETIMFKTLDIENRNIRKEGLNGSKPYNSPSHPGPGHCKEEGQTKSRVLWVRKWSWESKETKSVQGRTPDRSVLHTESERERKVASTLLTYRVTLQFSAEYWLA